MENEINALKQKEQELLIDLRLAEDSIKEKKEKIKAIRKAIKELEKAYVE